MVLCSTITTQYTSYPAIYMFYPNGLFVLSNSHKIIKYFENEDSDYKSVVWGTYRIVNDTIRTQQIFLNGWLYGPLLSEIDYLILPEGDKKDIPISKKQLLDILKASITYQ